MWDVNYSLQAIKHSFRLLDKGPAYLVEDNKKYDLSRLLIDINGVSYIDHLRMRRFLAKSTSRRAVS